MIKDITPRLYQETILSKCSQKNCLVVLPTGMGKTVIALMLAAHRLKNFPNSKILFLAPTRPLAEQHMQMFLNHLDINEDETALFTGYVKPEKRAELWKQAKIIFSTPQGLENDIITNRISLSDVSLMVFDEAHRATGDYAYTFLAKQYNQKARYPRILALTASPGSDGEKIKEVCSNLFIEDVEVRTENDADVNPYVQEIKVEWVKADFPSEFKIVHKHLKNCYKKKINEVNSSSSTHLDPNNGKTEILKLQGYLHAQISKGEKSFETLKSISLLAEALKTEHAIALLETQGIAPLYNYFEKLFSEAESSKVKAVKNLVSDEDFKAAFLLTKRLYDDGIEHPKISILKGIVEKEVMSNRSIKIIIFNQYRDSAKKIKETIDSIENTKSEIFVGQAKKNGVGLSQKKQKQMLQDFKEGKFNCLVATSVAEEGIDVPNVDLVVFYEPIPSGIRTIQRRGRTGRQDRGRVIVLVTKDTRDEAYKWSAFHKEKRMHRELDELKTRFSGITTRSEENLERFISPEVNLSVFADLRERSSGVIKELIGLGININLKTLDVGDYILSSNVCVEYKKTPDFVDSIIDGRLLDQIRSLKTSFSRPLIIIEGENDLYTHRNIHPNAIRGMLSAIVISYGIPILQTKNSQETAALMAVIAKREQDPEFREFNPHASRKPMALREQQEYIVSALPGIGLTLAKPLLQKFGSVLSIFNAQHDELKEIENIGDKKAEKIREVIEKKYDDKNGS